MVPTLLQNLQQVKKQTFAAIATGAEKQYFSTLTLVFGAKIEIAVMLDAPTAGGDSLLAIEKFGYKTGGRRKGPEFTFFAAESTDRAGREQIMVSGCSNEFEVVLCYLALERDGTGNIEPGEWGPVGPVAKEDVDRVPAFRAMRGALAKASAPWWKW